MKKDSIKSHLSPYSIFQKRKTTINHAFASAIAPVDKYDGTTLRDALQLLGQKNPDGDLDCVYCGLQAETWDHLVGLVKNGELRGHGHQLGNLVPCCSSCNSKKGAKDWEKYLGMLLSEPSAFAVKQKCIASYAAKATPVEVYLDHAKSELPEDWKRYFDIRDEILKLMKDADDIAKRLRAAAAAEHAALEDA